MEYTQVVLPFSLWAEVMHHTHLSILAGHLGVDRTANQVTSRFWWPGIWRDIQCWLVAYVECQAKKTSGNTKSSRLEPIPVQTEPFYMLGFDIVGPLPRTPTGKCYMLVYMDYFTKWVEVDCFKHQDTHFIADLLVHKIILCHGALYRLLSDHGKAFMSCLVGTIQQHLGIEHVNTTSYHPQTNSLTKCCNCTLVEMLAKFINSEQTDWDTYAP